MQAVLGLVVDHGVTAFHDLVGDLLVAMGRQAVHDDALRVGGVYQLHVDLEPLERFLENVKACKVRLLVFLSFAGADRNTFPPHHRIEKAIEAAGIPYAHLRTGFLMDNFLTVWSRELLDKDLVYAPGGRTPHAFVSGSDTALAAATVLADPARFRETAWDLTGPAALTFKEAAEVLGRIAGRKIRYKNPGLFAFRNYCAEKKGMGGDALARWVTFFVMAKMGAGKKATGDFTKITGRAPQALEQFLRANQRDWDRS